MTTITSKQAIKIIRKIQKMRDPEAMLTALAEVRKCIPPEFRRAPEDIPELPFRLHASDEEEFAWNAVAEAVLSLGEEIHAVREAQYNKLSEAVMDIYYKCEEAIRDPEYAYLIPHVEKMRAIYLRSNGVPIPTKEENDERRKQEAEEDALRELARKR